MPSKIESSSGSSTEPSTETSTESASPQEPTSTEYYEVQRGNPDGTQLKALQHVITSVVAHTRARRDARPHTRGWYGVVGDTTPGALLSPVRGVDVEANPTAFRLPDVPPAPSQVEDPLNRG